MSLKTFQYSIPTDLEIKVYFTQYSNCSLLIITQVNKLGIFILAEAENPEASQDEKVYNIETKFGDRLDEWSLVLARTAIETLNLNKMMIVVSIVHKTPQIFNEIIQSLSKLLD